MSLSINHNIPSSWLIKMTRCNNKWNFWKLNLLNITKLRKSWPSGLISAIESFKNTKPKLRCWKRRSRSVKSCSPRTMLHPWMIHHPSATRRTGRPWKEASRRIVTNQIWPLSSRRESLNTKGNNKSPRISWTKSKKSTKSYSWKWINKRANTRILFTF